MYRRFVPGSAGAGNQFARRHRSRMVVMLCFFMVLLLFVVCAGYNKSPCTEIAFCARADQSNNLWCHLACCAINCTAALRRTNIPLPCNGGFRQRILSPAFPRALGEPFIHSAYHPVPSIGGSLCVRLWFYFRFIGLKYLYHACPRLSTLFGKKVIRNFPALCLLPLHRRFFRAKSAASRPTPLPECRCFP